MYAGRTAIFEHGFIHEEHTVNFTRVWNTVGLFDWEILNFLLVNIA